MKLVEKPEVPKRAVAVQCVGPTLGPVNPLIATSYSSLRFTDGQGHEFTVGPGQYILIDPDTGKAWVYNENSVQSRFDKAPC